MIQKKLVFTTVIFLILGISGLFAQYEFMHRDGGSYRSGFMGSPISSFNFRAPNIVVFSHSWQEGWESHNTTRTGTYSIEHEYGVPFLNINWEDGASVRYLMLADENMMVLYTGNTEPEWNLIWIPYYAEMGWGHPTLISDVTASSTLREGHVLYAATPERLGLHINRVWAVEGGVGERLFIMPGTQAWRLSISIGYVHFSRPYLFQQNSRPKKIRIFDAIDETIFFDMELRDTPNFQTINFSSIERAYIIGSIGLIIEILEIYPGTRFNHMCINSIVGWWSQ